MAHLSGPSGQELGGSWGYDVSLLTSKRSTAHNLAPSSLRLAQSSFHDAFPAARYHVPTNQLDTRPRHDSIGPHDQSQRFNVAQPAWRFPSPARAPREDTPYVSPSEETFSFTPHDTYRYPESPPPVEPIAAQPTTTQRSAPVNTALAQWYLEQVLEVLIQPGHHREAVGGASDELWGSSGVERASWERLGVRSMKHPNVNPWGAQVPPAKPSSALRRAIIEPYDPFVLTYGHEHQISSTLVGYFDEVLLRMAIPTSSVVAAVWYLKGLAFHEGDGGKGMKLRRYLRELWGTSLFAIEKRVAVLGLMLAGKWLDDNSYLVKSWSEISDIPSSELIVLDRLALEDLHYSLSIPVTAWTEHVSQLFTQLVARNCADDLVGSMIITYFDEMVIEARASESAYLDSKTGPRISERRPSIPVAADQAIDRAWCSFAASYQVDANPLQTHPIEAHPHRQEWIVNDMQVDDSARAVSALIDDNETEEEFLEYDGAQRWIPPVVEIRRSDSNASTASYRSVEAINQWRYAATVESQQPEPIGHRPSHNEEFFVASRPNDWKLESDPAFWHHPPHPRQVHLSDSKATPKSLQRLHYASGLSYPRSDTTLSPVPQFQSLYDHPFWIEPGITASRQPPPPPPSQNQFHYSYAEYPSYNHGFGFPNVNHQLSGLTR